MASSDTYSSDDILVLFTKSSSCLQCWVTDPARGAHDDIFMFKTFSDLIDDINILLLCRPGKVSEQGNALRREVDSCFQIHAEEMKLLRSPAEMPGPMAAAVLGMKRVIMIGSGSSTEECPICLEEYEIGGDPWMTTCLHKYHLNCIYKWLQICPTCPLCRIRIYNST